jgi:hypothetical protein
VGLAPSRQARHTVTSFETQLRVKSKHLAISNHSMAEDLTGTGMSGLSSRSEHKKQLHQVFALMALDQVVSRHGKITQNEQYSRGLAYYVGAINTWVENNGMLILGGKTVDWLAGTPFSLVTCGIIIIHSLH